MSDITKNTLQDDIADNRQNRVLLAQIRECFGRVAYSHKTHEKQADILLDKDIFWKWTQITLSVVASGSFLATFSELFGHEKLWAAIGSILAAMLAAINLYFKNFNYGAKAQEHKETAVLLWNIRESYISLITDLTESAVDVGKARNVRDALQANLSDIYKNAPRTSSKAYAKAQDALKFKEDLTFSQSEIDMLLPTDLRLEKQENNQ